MNCINIVLLIQWYHHLSTMTNSSLLSDGYTILSSHNILWQLQVIISEKKMKLLAAASVPILRRTQLFPKNSLHDSHTWNCAQHHSEIPLLKIRMVGSGSDVYWPLTTSRESWRSPNTGTAKPEKMIQKTSVIQQTKSCGRPERLATRAHYWSTSPRSL